MLVYGSSGLLSLCDSSLERLSRSIEWEACVLFFGIGEARLIMSSVWPGYGGLLDGTMVIGSIMSSVSPGYGGIEDRAMAALARGLIGEVVAGGVGQEGLVVGCGLLGSGLEGE